MNSRSLTVLLWTMAATHLWGGEARRLFEAVEPHMGTLVSIKLYARDQNQAQAAMWQAFHRIAELDDILSDYKPESELNCVCRTAWAHPVRVSPELFRVLTASQKLAAETDGAFDVTIGPVTHLWREARRTGQVPDAGTLRQAMSHCGYRKLLLHAGTQTVKLAEPGMQLDLGGIGKGYVADQVIALLSSQHIRSALVAASGDLAFSDPPPGQLGWRIRIPSQDKLICLHNGAASTSGNAEQHLDLGGVRYSHIIDPSTGWGITQDVTVTVLASNGTEADSLATAVSVCLAAPNNFRRAWLLRVLLAARPLIARSNQCFSAPAAPSKQTPGPR